MGRVVCELPILGLLGGRVTPILAFPHQGGRDKGDCAEGAVDGALGCEGAVDEVDFLDGPRRGVYTGSVLDGGADDVALGLGEGAADASEGEVGSEGAAVGVEAKVAAVLFDGGLEVGEGGQVAVEADPEDAGVVGIGKDAEIAKGEGEWGVGGWRRLRGRLEVGGLWTGGCCQGI